MRLGWITDPHLEFVDRAEVRAVGRALSAAHPADAVVLTGDIGHCDTFLELLADFAAGLAAPVYFVLGNHDLYRGSLARAHHQAAGAAAGTAWLTGRSPVPLASGVALVGHDGFYDARAADPFASDLFLNDFLLVEDLQRTSRAELVAFLRDLGDRCAAEAERSLRAAAVTSSTVVFATHCPPFREAAWHEGRICGDDWLPWFTSVVMGEMLLRVAADHPSVDFTILCGHTHSGGTAQLAPNLQVLTGGAEYGSPSVERVFAFSD